MSASDATSDVELQLSAKPVELAGGRILRALPQAARRMVGPFIFFDQLGGGVGDVLSHPHIGLSTVTYLFDGQLTHRDSLGSVQVIRPGDVNWMTAGKGIVHAELLGAPATEPRALAGVQLWVALPTELEDCAPSFVHHPAADLPRLDEGGAQLRLIAGSLWGVSSPVKTASPLFYAELRLEPGAVVSLPPAYTERAAYLVEGSLELGSAVVPPATLSFFKSGAEVLIRALDSSRVLLLGGEPLEGRRHIHWNFVSSSRERLEQAREDWRAHRFPRVPGETRFIPLPGDGDGPQLYPETT